MGVLLPGLMAQPEGSAAFRSSLERRGLVEGKNLNILLRTPEPNAQYLTAAHELVAADVDVIVAMGGSLSVRAAKEATQSIPIIMMSSADPVGDGLVASLANPGGNVTGNCIFGVELVLKRLQLLVHAVGKPTTAAYLQAGSVFTQRYKRYDDALSQLAREIGVRIEFVRLREMGSLEAAFTEIQRRGVDALVLDNPASFIGQEQRIASIALEQRLPAITDFRSFAAAGLLLSYGPNLEHVLDRTADYVARIWRGAVPQDLPVELVSKFDLAVNASTAKALGVSIPKSFMVMVTRVYG